MPLFLFPIITLVAYAFVWANIWFNKQVGAKSFSHLALLCNIVTLAIIFIFQTRVPMGGFFEVGSEMSLILGVIYTVFIPIDLRKLSLTLIGAAILCLIISLLGGMQLAPHLYTYVSWWQQFAVQAHLLAGGLLLFCLLCYGNVIFVKDKTHVTEIAGFARTGLLLAVLVLLLGFVAGMMWNFVVTGELLLWDSRSLMSLMLTVVLLLPLVSQKSWFKEARYHVLFNAMVVALVFLVNLAEWGGLS